MQKSSKNAAATSQRRCNVIKILSLVGQQDQMRGGAAGWLVCGAVNIDVVRPQGGRPGMRHEVAGSNSYVFACGQSRKLVPQLLIALDQLFGALPHLRHLLDKRR
jgi:hypothetical protein